MTFPTFQRNEPTKTLVSERAGKFLATSRADPVHNVQYGFGMKCLKPISLGASSAETDHTVYYKCIMPIDKCFVSFFCLFFGLVGRCSKDKSVH